MQMCCSKRQRRFCPPTIRNIRPRAVGAPLFIYFLAPFTGEALASSAHANGRTDGRDGVAVLTVG
jgi:multisubunit Na+/H+ antiporter MnhG subunit